MLKKRWIFLVQVLAVCLYVVAPLQTGADSVSVGSGSGTSATGTSTASATASFAPLIITEVQAGSASSASEEFIELYNQSSQPITLASSQWQLQIASSKATSWASPYRTVALSGTIAAGGYYLLASSYQAPGATGSYLSTSADATFSAGLSADSGHVRLVYSTTSGVVATQTTDDELEWTTSTGGQPTSASIDSRTPFALSTSLVGGTSLKRLVTASGIFVDTNNDDADFILSPCPTPTGARASAALAATQAEPTSGGVTAQASTITPAPTTVDITNQACVTTPVTDPGSTNSSGDTDGLTTPTVDPPSTIVAISETDSTQDTTQVTAASIPQRDVGLAAPQLTEILPNPAAPLTDANDEFIEVYNSNAQAFDLSGFSFETGGKTKHHYTFPQGTSLLPGSFVAFFSSTTGIGLSNSGGQVSLLDPLGTTIGQTATYTTAKDGQAWALAKGTWQWTTTPTPNAANVITTPAAKLSAAAKTTKKSTSKSAAVAKKSTKVTTASTKATSNFTDTSTTTTPIHPGVLALTAVFALLYGAYEYRTDVANRIYQLRKYRAHRREHRASLAGRRGG